MYWIYLIIFVATVFVPEFIRHGFWGLTQSTTQELFLFFLSVLGFSMFLAHEKHLARMKQEKTANQRELNRLNKDLNSSYSYIGETNRKLDILKNIVLAVPTAEAITAEKERELLYMIVQAAHILTKSKKIILRLSKEYVGMLKEVKSEQDLVWTWKLEREKFWTDKGCFFENEECFMFVSQKYMGNIKSSLIIMKDVAHRTIEDLEFMKTLVFYALLIFSYCEESRKLNKHKTELNIKNQKYESFLAG